MESPPKTSVGADEFYILKRGEILGPFTAVAVRTALERGEFSLAELVQTGDVPIWQPLSRWLEKEHAAERASIAPEWTWIVTWAARRLRSDVLEGSAIVGGACVAIGALTAVLARWPAALWLPWFALAVLAGIFALRKERVIPGVLVLVAVAAVPVLFSLANRGRPTPDVSTVVPEASPKSALASEATRVVSAPPSLPESLPPLPEPALPPPVAPREISPVAPAENLLSLPQPALPTVPPMVVASVPLAPTPPPDFPPLPNTTPSAPPPLPLATTTEGDLVQRYYGALVLVKDGPGSGSGFICNAWGQTRLFTNIHVVAGMKLPQFTALDGTRLNPGAAEAAAGHDVMRLSLPAPPTMPLELMTNFESNVKIGDDIVVIGNSGGGGVVTKLEGKLVGIGPDRIEVSAEFIPGNSGSPIIHTASGKVIGIATYLMRRYDEFSSNTQASGRSTPGAMVVRRFAYRLDSVPRWEPVNGSIFQNEAERLQRISALTEDVFDFLGALRKKQAPHFATETLRRPANDWLGAVRGRRSDADRLRATQSFLAALRSMARADVTAAETQIRYSYFREELRKEREVRDKLYKAFDDDSRQLSAPVQTAY